MRTKPTSISKLEGLQKIDFYALPHPNWRFLEAANELPSAEWTNAAHGWTVRSCPARDYSFALPAEHMLKYDQIRAVVTDFKRRLPQDVHFVVYPSWRFLYAGGCHITPTRLTIEVVEGDIAPLLRGTRSPDLIIQYDRSSLQRVSAVEGRADLIEADVEKAIVRSCRWINPSNLVVLEWSRTDAFGLLFHDWFEYV